MEDLGSVSGLGRSPGEGKGYLFQYSGLENSRDCIVHGVAKSWTRLSEFHFTGGPVVKNPSSSTRGMGLIPGQETKILHATRHGLKKKKKKERNEGILTQAPSGDHPSLKISLYVSFALKL